MSKNRDTWCVYYGLDHYVGTYSSREEALREANELVDYEKDVFIAPIIWHDPVQRFIESIDLSRLLESVDTDDLLQDCILVVEGGQSSHELAEKEILYHLRQWAEKWLRFDPDSYEADREHEERV